MMTITTPFIDKQNKETLYEDIVLNFIEFIPVDRVTFISDFLYLYNI